MNSTLLASVATVTALATLTSASVGLAATGEGRMTATLARVGQEQASGVTLPAGIKKVAFGHAEDTKTPTGGASCAIPKPLSDPIEFDAGTIAISFTIEVDPQIVRGLNASVEGDLGSSNVRSENCNAYAICSGRICQTQYGSTVTRSDGKALRTGQYKLSIEVGDQTFSLPFAIK